MTRQITSERPNIVVILTDQQRYDTIRALGFDYVDTPNLDRLIEQGVTFTNCFSAAPTCAPARASLFTGCYPHNTGVYKNADFWRHSIVENFSAAGYHCTNIGKMHTWPFETPLGFDERFVVENKDRYLEGRYFFDRWDMALRARGLEKQQREKYRMLPDYSDRLGAFEWLLDEDMHPDFFVGDMAAWWIRNKPDIEPFFLEIGFPGPHPPYDPIPRYVEPYLDRDLPITTVDGADFDSLPPAHQELIEHNCRVDHDSVVWTKTPSREQLKRLWAHYLANVTMIDEKVGDIMQALEDQGYANNTVVLFTSDHGDCLGEHGHIQKWVMYDSIVRMPTILWGPQYFKGPSTVDGLCQQFDLLPPIMDLAGVEPPESWDARSIAPLLDQIPSNSIREYVFAEQGGVDPSDPGGGFLTGTRLMTMVRSDRYKLVHYLDDKDQGELYDLEHDPTEQHNRWADPGFADIKNRLIRVLLEWRMESGLDNRAASQRWR